MSGQIISKQLNISWFINLNLSITTTKPCIYCKHTKAWPEVCFYIVNKSLNVWNQESLDALTNNQCMLTHTANTWADNGFQWTRPSTNIPNSKSLPVKVTPNISKQTSIRTLSRTCDENIPEDLRIGSSIFSFLTLYCLSLLWASNNSAKYQQAIPPDTLTFQLSPLLSHKDTLVLSEMDNLKQQRKTCSIKMEKRFWNVQGEDISECIKQLWQQTANRINFKKMQKTWR